ncbi:ricin-type beta-trefoil lectin domain protein [Ideonella azotifigens]|uniref:Ricin B lectin domain-containing protein n=1 Tax=Ideonella azotifigens TaxID=513160 RepID=A0ABN1KAV3_9BURK|nr:RICIN domain-containing protein [Ideonella azotifigens]MCD2338756.1 ricin-type beta-trefoil lectin domain protein [Ideonella azotifigens]
MQKQETQGHEAPASTKGDTNDSHGPSSSALESSIVKTSPARLFRLHQRRRAGRAPSRVLCALATGVAAAALTLAGTPARAAGYTNIRVWNTTHCLDNATDNASKLQMWSCDSGSDEKWLKIYNSQLGSFRFINQRTGRCITAPSSGGAAITMKDCDLQALNQEWTVYYSDHTSTGWYYMWQSASLSGYCLNTDSVGNGTVITSQGCNLADQYQHWLEG